MSAKLHFLTNLGWICSSVVTNVYIIYECRKTTHSDARFDTKCSLVDMLWCTEGYNYRLHSRCELYVNAEV